VNIIFRKELSQAEDPVARKAELVAEYRAKLPTHILLPRVDTLMM